MPRYLVTHAYQTDRLGPWVAGDEVELDDAIAAHVERDSPGTLQSATGQAERAVIEPPRDRMVRQSRRRDRQGDPGDQGVMSSDELRATRSG